MLAIDPNDCYVVIDSAFAVGIFESLIGALVFLVVLLLAISVHEGAHAAVSYFFGDNTAYLLGRVSLNPRKHADPIGSLLLPIAGFASGGAIIGWGKPTPVNERKWTNYRVGKFCVAIAGVVANLILVAIGIVIAKILIRNGFESSAFVHFFTENPVRLYAPDFSWLNLTALFTSNLILVNFSLFLFNLLPIPPLDGGNILSSFLPDSFKPIFDFVARFGFVLILAVLIILAYQELLNIQDIFEPVKRLVETDIF